MTMRTSAAASQTERLSRGKSAIRFTARLAHFIQTLAMKRQQSDTAPCARRAGGRGESIESERREEQTTMSETTSTNVITISGVSLDAANGGSITVTADSFTLKGSVTVSEDGYIFIPRTGVDSE
jgi:hypothetical protein